MHAQTLTIRGANVATHFNTSGENTAYSIQFAPNAALVPSPAMPEDEESISVPYFGEPEATIENTNDDHYPEEYVTVWSYHRFRWCMRVSLFVGLISLVLQLTLRGVQMVVHVFVAYSPDSIPSVLMWTVSRLCASGLLACLTYLVL